MLNKNIIFLKITSFGWCFLRRAPQPRGMYFILIHEKLNHTMGLFYLIRLYFYCIFLSSYILKKILLVCFFLKIYSRLIYIIQSLSLFQYTIYRISLRFLVILSYLFLNTTPKGVLFSMCSTSVLIIIIIPLGLT